MNIDQVKKELITKRIEMQNDWDRVLPSNELLFDRWEKADLCKAGKGSSIYDSSILMGNVVIGKTVWIGPWVLLDGTGGELFIGDYCNISAGVQIYTHDTIENVLSGGDAPKKNAPVKIDNNCYIAPMCIISKGVTIGECSVVAANSFVNTSFDSHSIIAGTPAKLIGKVVFNNKGHIHFEYEI